VSGPGRAVSTGGTKLPYRPALDGVRVVAVVLVLAFHAGMHRVPGGFIGVDVFFVLSGFLITRLLLAAAYGGGISFVDFYARRMRRLLPVALLVLGVTSLVWIAVASAVEREPLLGDARAAAMYFANWHFAAHATDYFASANQHSPFEHFWSLSVEEQFYLAWPAVVAAVFLLSRRNPGRARRRLAVLTVLLLVGSVALLLSAMHRGDPSFEYFGTHTRAYQLLAGALLTLCCYGRNITVTNRAGRAAASLGQLLALGSLLVLAGTAVHVSVGVRGMLTAAFAVLLLASLELDPRGLAARPLSWSTVTYLGQISYGTYLWHWPVILLIERFVVISPHSLFGVAMVLSFGLAALSHRLVEQPIRRSPALAARSRGVLAAGLAASAVAGLLVLPPLLTTDRDPAVTPLTPFAVDATGGQSPTQDQLPPETGAPETGAPGPGTSGSKPTGGTKAPAPRTPVPGRDAIKAAGQGPPAQTCLQQIIRLGCLSRQGSGPKVLVLGDSHLQMYFTVFNQLAERHDLTLYTWMYYVCPWEDGVLPSGSNAAPCRENRKLLYDKMLPTIKPDVVITINRGYDDPNYPRDLFQDGAPGETNPGRVLTAALPAAVDKIRSYGARLIVIEPTPSTRFNQRECLSRATYVQQCASRSAGKLPSEQALEARAKTRHDVTAVDLDKAICPRLPLCDAAIDGIVVRKDNDHPSLPFTASVLDLLDQKLTTAGAYR